MTTISLSRPPQGHRVLRTWTLDSVEELTHLRADLTRALDAGGTVAVEVSQQVVDGMVLVSSELATNALKHAHPPTTVTLAVDSETFLLDVADDAPDAVPALAQNRGPGESGFGLVLAARLATTVGWYTAGGTKHIWATFPAHAKQLRAS